MTTLLIKPLDVLMLRGNRLFGGAVHGGAQMPPWPSVVCGAVVSRALADKGRILDMTARPNAASEIVEEVLGPDFRLTNLLIMQGGHLWCPPPADLWIGVDQVQGFAVHPLRPVQLPEGMGSNCPLPLKPVLHAAQRRKPAGKTWLRLDGLAQHLEGRVPDSDLLLGREQLWSNDPRLGIALDGRSRTAVTGAIYTTDAIALRRGVCLAASFRGRGLPTDGLLRLGGDGRGAEVALADEDTARQLKNLGRPQPGWKGFRMILATPGIFPHGWRPPGVDDGFMFSMDGLRARLVAAAVPRHEVVSGWDLANHAPKPAQKVIPVGACYWFEVEDGDTSALDRIHACGLWPFLEKEKAVSWRKREGWNHVWFGQWEP